MSEDCHYSCGMGPDGSLNRREDHGSSPTVDITGILISAHLLTDGTTITYLACSLANPLCVLTEELTPGNKEGFKDSKMTSAFVRSAAL
jgi:hypothetical protein